MSGWQPWESRWALIQEISVERQLREVSKSKSWLRVSVQEMYVEKQLWEVSKSSSWLQVSIQEMCVEIQLWGVSKSRSWLRISIQKMCVERQLWETSKSRRWLWVSIQIKHLAPGQPQASACHAVLSSQAYSANILLDHNGTSCQFIFWCFQLSLK